MSKIVKLLKKANEEKNEKYSSLPLNAKTKANVRKEPDFEGPKHLIHPQDEDDVKTPSVMEKMQPYTLIAVSLIALISLFVSLNANGQNKIAKKQALNVSNDYQAYVDRMDGLENQFAQLKNLQLATIRSLQIEVEKVANDLERAQLKNENYAKEAKVIKGLISDLKVTDRLMLDKIISINGKIK